MLAELVEDRTAYPLMMHGVGAYSWHACVDHPALGATMDLTPRLSDENPTTIVAVLKGEPGTCIAESSDVRIARPPGAAAPTEQGKSPPGEVGKLPSERGPTDPPPTP